MSDTTYSFKSNRVDRVHGPKKAKPHVAEPREEAEVLDEEGIWEGQSTEVTRLHEEMNKRLTRSETKLNAVAAKIEKLRRIASESPAPIKGS